MQKHHLCFRSAPTSPRKAIIPRRLVQLVRGIKNALPEQNKAGGDLLNWHRVALTAETHHSPNGGMPVMLINGSLSGHMGQRHYLASIVWGLSKPFCGGAGVG